MIRNLIGDEWVEPSTSSRLPIYDPATVLVIDEVPLSGTDDVDRAVRAAARAFETWSKTSVMDRAAVLFRYKAVLEEHAEELARIVSRHHGKTLDEARSEVRRGIEVVDFACGAPTLLQGRTLRQVSVAVDQDLYRFPVGVVAGITPFNFPVMIPLWMVPVAIVAGNTFVLKPSERTPLGSVRLAELFLEAGLPAGVLNIVHGAAEVVDALLVHPNVHAVSFVGSEPVARYVYAEAARHRKRVQAAGGAKNHIVVLPDADLDQAVPAILNSAFGNAGERCLAGSAAIAVGEVHDALVARVAADAASLVVGPGDDAEVQIGPLIRDEHRRRVIDYIGKGIAEGARVITDGRSLAQRAGFFLGPTVLDDVSERRFSVPPSQSAGRVRSMMRSRRPTASHSATWRSCSRGRAARAFRERVDAGMIGVNVGVAQPFAFYPFSGWKGSFYGDLHIHGTDGFDFYTRKKMVVSRW